MARDLDAELLEQQLAHRAAGHPRHGLPGARTLQDVARVAAIVLEHAGEIGVPRSRPRHLTAPLRPGGVRLGGHDVLPMLPVSVPHEHRDRRAERLPRAHAGEPFDLVGLDLHARAAAVAAHAALQLGVDAVGRDREAGGNALQHRHEPAAVRFACRREAERHPILTPCLPAASIITREPDLASGSRHLFPSRGREVTAAARGSGSG